MWRSLSFRRATIVAATSLICLIWFYYVARTNSALPSDSDYAGINVVPEDAGTPTKVRISGYQLTAPTAPTVVHQRLYSLTSRNGEFIPIVTGSTPSNNANIIPHPGNSSLWIISAQNGDSESTGVSHQVACAAAVQDGSFQCITGARALPVIDRAEGNCEDRYQLIKLIRGSRDARVFYGPEIPYIICGSHSNRVCLGQWLQDARILLQDEFGPVQSLAFYEPIELQRSPSVTQPLEKNYFLFWDPDATPYVHYNLWPRSYGSLLPDGSVTDDLARHSAEHDQSCMDRFMPWYQRNRTPDGGETIHQATNSLSVTLCARNDPTCIVDDTNTFIMHLFHHKRWTGWHGTYEPYIILYRRVFPFKVHAIGRQPYWIHGRPGLTAASGLVADGQLPDSDQPDFTSMFYITSMSWRSHDQKYHGYMDDVLFLSFGIEDTRGGIMDIRAQDLLQNLSYC